MATAREAGLLEWLCEAQGLVARLSATPGRLRWAGRPLGADTESVLAELDALAPRPPIDPEATP